MRGDDRWRLVPVDVIIAAGLECFHQGALAAVAERDDWQSYVLGVGADDSCDFECAHFPHVRSAENRRGHVIFERRQCKRCLRTRNHLETFALQRIAQPLGKIHITVNQ
jgi:hypothetical protein